MKDFVPTAHLSVDDATGATGYPISFSCWFRLDDADNPHSLIWIGDKDVATFWIALRAEGDDVGDPVTCSHHEYGGGNFSKASTTTGYSADTLHHACGVIVAADDFRVYLDGGGKGTSAGSGAGNITAHDRIAIGLNRDSTPGNPADGEIAEVAIWNSTLTDADAASLAARISPLLVQPDGLVFYAPLIRDNHEIILGKSLAETGTITVTPHPPMIYPTPPISGFAAAAAIAEIPAARPAWNYRLHA